MDTPSECSTPVPLADGPLPALLIDIYDAAHNPCLWPSVLQKICGFVGASAANLVLSDPSGEDLRSVFQWSNSTRHEELYRESWFRYDPVLAALPHAEVNLVLNLNDIVQSAAVEETDFFREWMAPQGLLEAFAVNLGRTHDCCGLLMIYVGESAVAGAQTRERLSLIAPHLAHALRIGAAIEARQSIARSLAVALDELADAVVLADSKARAVFMNREARTLIAEGSVLSLVRGTLATQNVRTTQALHEFLASANPANAAAPPERMVLALSAPDGQQWLAHVVRLVPEIEGGRRFASGAAAAIVLRRVSPCRHFPAAAISALFRLTPTELRVLTAVVEVGGVPAIAEALGISETTVRTHLQNLFGKTGTRRQVDLVKLVISASNPFRD